MEGSASTGARVPKPPSPEKFKRGCDQAARSDDSASSEVNGPSMRMERYGRRFWAVWDGPKLICVTVYRKGARTLIDLITSLRAALATNQ